MALATEQGFPHFVGIRRPVSEDGPYSRWEDPRGGHQQDAVGSGDEAGDGVPRSRCLTILVFWRKRTGERTDR